MTYDYLVIGCGARPRRLCQDRLSRVDGVQYIAVQSGWGVDAQRMQNRIDQAYGLKTDVPQGGVVWSFAIK